ncbi:MAG: TraB/GumN family protein [Pseudomonadota bacterium]
MRFALLALPVLAACAADLGTPIELDITENEASPALWRVHDDDSSIYLFGTIHSLPRGVPWQTDYVEAAFADADVLVTESNAWFGDWWSTNRVIRLEGHYPEDRSLSDEIAPTTNQQLVFVSEALDLDLDAIDRMRPWLVAWHLGGTSAGDVDMRRRYGVETILYAKAELRELPLGRLERASDVMKAFAALDDERQEAMLISALDDVVREEDPETMRKMINLWLRGDPEGLSALRTTSSLAQHTAFHGTLITDRNRAWLQPLIRYLADDTNAFVAVGAAHLSGSDSVAVMLEELGYEVERLDPAGRAKAG